MSFTREMEVVRDQIKSLLELIPSLQKIETTVNENPTKMDLIADVAFLTKKTGEILDAVQKKLNELENLAATKANDLFPYMEEQKYSTVYCTISNNTQFYCKFPSSPTAEGYHAFVRQLPPEAVRPHFPTVTELIDKKLQEGEQIPFGLPKFGIVGILPKLRVTSKKEL